jgi:hypothetical protein
MAHEGLERPCIDSTSRQGVAGSMAEHVSVDREWQLSGHDQKLTFQRVGLFTSRRFIEFAKGRGVKAICSKRGYFSNKQT